MNTDKISTTIKTLRKQNNLTQVQLAEKLNVSDKAVSKWEIGTSIPDIQQIESIVRLFNISYDSFFNGQLDGSGLIEGMPKQQIALAKARGRKRFDPTEWYKLDNAAKVYPPEAEAEWNSVYRISAVMKETVDRGLLQQALDDTVDRFPTLMVTIKKGAFWYYFDRLQQTPKIEDGGKYPCSPIPLDGKHYLFRVTCDARRVGVEIFHSITDGTGASIFLVSLLTRYYQLRYGEVKEFTGAKNVFDLPKAAELDDSFNRFAQKSNYAKREINTAYLVKGEKIKYPVVIHVILNSDEVRGKAKGYGATVTEFISAALIKSLLKKREYDKSDKPVILQIPVNLRNIFPSETMRNFAYFVGIEVDDKDISFEDLVATCHEQLKKGLDKEFLQQNINANVREERNIFIRLVPLMIKNFGLNFARKILGDKAFTLGFSNLGNLKAPDELKYIIDRFEFILKEPKDGGVAFSGITFNNNMTLSFSRSIWSSDVEREFVACLNELGLKAFVETNEGEYDERV